MPYRHAWMFIVALLALTLAAFWRSYFAILSTSPMGFHVHGTTATLWMLLLLAQSRTAHARDRSLHRTLGLASFVAVPAFAAGAAGVVHSMAVATRGGNPFYALWGAPLAVFDLLAFAAFLAVTTLALRHRRNVMLHAGYMLSTGLLLLGPALGRIINQTVPGLTIHGPPDFHLFRWGIHLAAVGVVSIAAWAYRRESRHGRPWAIVGTVTIVQAIGFELLGPLPAWRAMFESVGRLPLGVMLVGGASAGVAATVIGWNAGRTRRRDTVTA